MAKKKKKVAKKAAKKKASGAAAAAPEAQVTSCTEQELQAAAVVTSSAELMAGLATEFVRELEARGIDIPELLRTVTANHRSSPASESVSGEENSRRGWDYARRQLERGDFADMPFLRVFGRVAEILLNYRRFQTITAGDVFLVFLVEIPDHIETNHRQNSAMNQPPSVKDADVSTGEGRRNFNARMKRLYEVNLVRPTVTRASGRKEDYVLTDDGQNMFDGWPPLDEIPGLEEDGPVKFEEPGSRGLGTRGERDVRDRDQFPVRRL